jgi:hypothetical protein
MSIREEIVKLANERNQPCVTISLNTHRTHPANAQDVILLKKLLKEAEERVISEFGKRPVSILLEKLITVANDIDVNYNSDSLHIFLSNETEKIIRLPWPAYDNVVHIAESFAVRTLIKAYSRSEEYLIMLLSQSGVYLYEALNDSIIAEIENTDFPFPANPHFIIEPEKRSDPKQMDNMVREFLNKVDKALVKVHNQTGLNCIVICTEDNYSRLMQVADKPNVYYGYAKINYNKTSTSHISKQSFEIIKDIQLQRITEAIAEIREAVAQGKVLTDLQEIFQAAIDGRGELLIVHESFSQAVIMINDRTFQLTSDPTIEDAIADITSIIAWEVLSKKGRVVFTKESQIKEFGKIVLKTRF